MYEINTFFIQGTILKAWIDVTSGKDAYARKAGKYFDEGLKERTDVFALMGKVGQNLKETFLLLLLFSLTQCYVWFIGTILRISSELLWSSGVS